MRLSSSIIYILFLAAAACAASPAGAVDYGKPIKEVLIEGAVRADQNTIRFYLQTQPGQKLDRDKVSQDIRKAHSLGYFDEVKVDVREEQEGLVVTFMFKEKPFVRDIILAGVENVEKDIVTFKLRTKKGAFFQKEYVPWERQRIKNLYKDKGYYFTEVSAKVHKLGNNTVDVEYVVDEGKLINVGLIKFHGNKVFPDHKLREVINTESVTWSTVVSSGGSYKKDALKVDRLALETFYHENGYIQVSIGEPQVEIDKEKRKIYIYFPVDEGELFHTGKITVEGDSVFGEEKLRELISLKEGDVFNRKSLREDIFKVTDGYSKKGYAFANVNPEFKVLRDERKVELKIKPEKGEKVYLGRIEISGNEVTRDRVIRREFLVSEGELFNSAKLRDSFQRINGLGFFEKVDFEQRSRGEADLVDLEVKVQERETGQFSLAVGYSSEEYVTVTGSLKWTNLLGKGQELSFSVDNSSRRQDFSFGFTEPAIFDRRLQGGVEVYDREYTYDSFQERKSGGALRIGRGVGDFTWARLGYKLEKSDISVGEEEDVSDYLLKQKGQRTVGALFPSITYNTKDDPYSPAKGMRLYGFLEYAGIGGDQKYYKTVGEVTRYFPLWFDFVGMAHAKAGYIASYDGKEVFVSEKFFMGGARDLRGFNLSEVGPHDENGQAIGGEALLQLNFELQYRFTRYFRGFGFYDRGNIYGSNDEGGNSTDKLYDISNMRQSWGFGIHFFSPMGPISLIYGFKLDKRKNESSDEFHFTIGGEF